MGSRAELTAKRGLGGAEYDDDISDGVHGMESACGDEMSLCGIYPVDGAVVKPTTKAISCHSCINVLEARDRFTKRNGKWY